MSPQSTPDLVRALYESLGINLSRTWRTEALARCFANPDAHHHADRSPSTSVNLESGAWCCHGCGASGGAYDAAIIRGHTPRSAMDLLIRYALAERRSASRGRQAGARPVQRASTATAGPPLTVTETDIVRWAARLAADARTQDQVLRQRGITTDVLVSHQVGLDHRRLTIPVRDEAARLIGLLRYDPTPRRTGPKMLAAAGSRRGLFPAPETIAGSWLVICEGEPDALASLSHGIPAVAIPGVAGWRGSWTHRLRRFEVTVCMDCDPEGRAAARRIATDLDAAGIPHDVFDLAPDRHDGYDLTDALLEGDASPLVTRAREKRASPTAE